MKKIVTIIGIFIILLIHSTVLAEDTKYFYDGKWNAYTALPISLEVKNEALVTDMPPILFNSYSVVPARAVFEKLDARVTWDESKSQVGVFLDDKVLLLDIDKNKASVNGAVYEMPIAPKIINDRTMIPVRFVAETLGMKVNWNEQERIIQINCTDARIQSVESELNGSTFRVTVTSNYPMKSYTPSKFNDPPRVAVDINDFVLFTKEFETPVASNYVNKIRAAQFNSNPNVTRIVADLSGWTEYNISLSEDKKKLYIDFNNAPQNISDVRATSDGYTDVIEIDMENSRSLVIHSMDEAGKIAIDIPLSAIGSDKSIPISGSYINSVQCSQYDANTARIIVATEGISMVVASDRDGGTKLEFTTPSSKGFFYSIDDNKPKLVLRNENIGINNFSYRLKKDENGLFVVSIPPYLMDLHFAKIIINDEYMDCIDLAKNYSTSFTDITFRDKKNFEYRVDTVSDNEELAVKAYSEGISTDTKINTAIKDKLIIIDPGHDITDPGTVGVLDDGTKLHEEDVNLDISLRLNEKLLKEGFKTMMTHTNTTDATNLYQRSDVANYNNAAILVSVHNNAGSGNGTMTLYYPSVYDKAYGITSERLAQVVQEELLKGLGTNDMGLWKRPGLVVINNSNVPTVIAEVAYLSDQTDRNNLNTETFRQKAAESLYNGIVKALSEVVTAQNTPSVVTERQKTSNISRGEGDSHERDINGFKVPSLSMSKCNYWASSKYSLSVELDYTNELDKISTLEEQRNEARNVLLSKLDEETVNSIMSEVAYFKDYSSHVFNENLSNSQYKIWLRGFRYSGIMRIDLIPK